jgi:hypothetical protein
VYFDAQNSSILDQGASLFTAPELSLQVAPQQFAFCFKAHVPNTGLGHFTVTPLLPAMCYLGA